MDFLRNKADFMKNRAVAQYGKSRNPLENLEYKLNLLIGPKKMRERMDWAMKTANPSDEALSRVIEGDIFKTTIIDRVSLFPKPQTKNERIIAQNQQYMESHSVYNSKSQS